MLAALVFTIAGTAIVVASTRLVHYGDMIAERTKLGQLWVGATLLSVATSLPEVAADVSATMIGAPNLAAGDLFGSSMANMLIFAIFSLWFARLWYNYKFTTAELITWAIAIIVTAEALLFIILDVNVVFISIGLGGILIAATYILGARRVFLISLAAANQPPQQENPVATDSTINPERRTTFNKPLWVTFALFGVWASIVLIAAPFLAWASEALAEITGVGESFFGVVALAILTSLPELAATITAFRMGLPSMVLGNLLGSNGFNMLIILPVDFSLRDGAFLQSIEPAHGLAATQAIVMMVAVMGGIRLLSNNHPRLGKVVLSITVLFYLSSMLSIFILTN